MICCFIILVKTIQKNEPKYYEDIVAYSKEKLMLYPYHLADKIVKGLRITPFQYYISILEKIMEQEKSYDSLPNFTAADCKKSHFYGLPTPCSAELRLTFLLFVCRFEIVRNRKKSVYRIDESTSFE